MVLDSGLGWLIVEWVDGGRLESRERRGLLRANLCIYAPTLDGAARAGYDAMRVCVLSLRVDWTLDGGFEAGWMDAE
jgi:hypothetical protein